MSAALLVMRSGDVMFRHGECHAVSESNTERLVLVVQVAVAH
jgi:hypothetical protein